MFLCFCSQGLFQISLCLFQPMLWEVSSNRQEAASISLGPSPMCWDKWGARALYFFYMADRSSPGELVVADLQASSFQEALNLQYPTWQSLFPVGVISMTVTQISFLSTLYLQHLPMSQLLIVPLPCFVLLQMDLKYFLSAGTQSPEMCESTGRPCKTQDCSFLYWCLILLALTVQPWLPANGMRYL